LISVWYDIEFWARPMKRAITSIVLNELSNYLLKWEIVDWDSVTLSVENDKLKILKK
jgi:ATP-dependent Clp protease ATP-binding subunit ClpA